MTINITIENLAIQINQHLEKNKLKDFPLQNFNITDFKNKINFIKNEYYRNIVYSNNLFEIIIISWSPSSITPIHYHPENGCLLKILQGELNEELFLNNKDIKNNILTTNSISYLDNNIGTHRISTKENTVSLHIYSPSGFYK